MSCNLKVFQDQTAFGVGGVIGYHFTGLSSVLTGAVVDYTMEDSAGVKLVDNGSCDVVIDDIEKTIEYKYKWVSDLISAPLKTYIHYARVTFADGDIDYITPTPNKIKVIKKGK